MPNCDFVDPKYNVRCTTNRNLTKIVIQIPDVVQPIIKFACQRHGDIRFNELSRTEDKITKDRKDNKIDYTEFSQKLKTIRWNQCRRCWGLFNDNSNVCVLEYFWLRGTRISLRRSFLLDKECLDSELKFYEIFEDTKKKVTMEKFT